MTLQEVIYEKNRIQYIAVFILLALICWGCKSSFFSGFDLEKAREIVTECETRTTGLNDNNKALLFIDSLQKTPKWENVSDYDFLFSALSIVYNKDTPIDNKIGALQQLYQRDGYEDVHPYVKYIIGYKIFFFKARTYQFQSALEQLHRLYEEINPYADILDQEAARIYSNIAGINIIINDGKSDAVNKLLLKSISIHKKNNMHRSVLVDYTNLCIYEKRKNNATNTLRYAVAGVDYYKTSATELTEQAWLFPYKGLVMGYAMLGNNEQVADIYAEGRRLFEEGVLVDRVYNNFLKYTLEYFLKAGMKEEVRAELNRLESQMDSLKDNHLKGLIYYNKAQLDTVNRRQNYIQAIHYLEEKIKETEARIKLTECLDSLISIDTQKQRYKEAQRWSEMKYVVLDKTLQNLTYYNSKMDYWADKNIEQEQQNIRSLKYFSRNFYIALFFISIVLTLALFLYHYYKRTKRNNILLEQQKQELNEKSDIINEQNQQLTKLVAELKDSNENLRHFAYSAAHDLNAPLRTISSFTNLLKKKYIHKVHEKDVEFFDFIVDGCTSLKGIIDGLLSFSQVNNDMGNPEDLELKKLIVNTFNILALQSEEDVQLKIDIEEGIPDVEVHQSLIRQLFLNLFSNAIKFKQADADCQITIQAQRGRAGYITMSIMDNGVGIPKENQANVFKMFTKMHPKVNYSGSGIGLATCKKIVNRYGGKIWVESEENVGTTFFFELPVTK